MLELLFSDDELTPPAAVAANAARGLRLRERFGRGGTEVGRARAEGLAARRRLSAADVRVVHAWFARHGAMRRGAGWARDEDPSAGWVAWLLWGGDEGRAWIAPLREKLRLIDAAEAPPRRPREARA